MAWNAYKYLWDSLVPLGYMIAFPTTENGSLFPAPNHAEFALDLAFLNTKIKSENTNSTSPFFGKLSGLSALMGHSMGGGAAFLAAQNNTSINALVTLAPAVTNPSSVTAGPYITVPTVVFAGENDCVTPPSQHSIPEYDSCASTCKIFVSVKGGSHCQFADVITYCQIGEGTCSPQPSISRAIQHDITLDFLKIYLNYKLKGDAASWTKFNDSITNSTRITVNKSCLLSEIEKLKMTEHIDIYPNPASNTISIVYYGLHENEINLLVYNAFGQIQKTIKLNKLNSETFKDIDISDLSSGVYFISSIHNNTKQIKRFIKL